MIRNISVGIDFGTHQTKVVVLEFIKENNKTTPKIIGVGISDSRGLKNGYIVNTNDAVDSIKQAIRIAEKSSGTKINKAFVGVGGIGLCGATSTASIVTSRADLVINDLDLDNLAKTCEENLPSSIAQNYRLINTVPLSYKIDGKLLLAKSPLDLKGSKIEVKTLFVACLDPHIKDLMEAMEEAGIKVLDVMASPLASSIVTLSKSQKMAGCVLVDIGAETVSVTVFENNIPTSLEVFPIGGSDITNDIALGLKISLEEAEIIKHGGASSVSVSKKKLDEIINARLSDIFELIENHLKKVGRNHLLPAGIFVTGGGASINMIEEFARTFLKIPARVATMNIEGQKDSVREPVWTVAYGLSMLGGIKDTTAPFGFTNTIKITKGKLFKWLEQFLP